MFTLNPRNATEFSYNGVTQPPRMRTIAIQNGHRQETHGNPPSRRELEEPQVVGPFAQALRDSVRRFCSATTLCRMWPGFYYGSFRKPARGARLDVQLSEARRRGHKKVAGRALSRQAFTGRQRRSAKEDREAITGVAPSGNERQGASLDTVFGVPGPSPAFPGLAG